MKHARTRLGTLATAALALIAAPVILGATTADDTESFGPLTLEELNAYAREIGRAEVEYLPTDRSAFYARNRAAYFADPEAYVAALDAAAEAEDDAATGAVTDATE